MHQCPCCNCLVCLDATGSKIQRIKSEYVFKNIYITSIFYFFSKYFNFILKTLSEIFVTMLHFHSCMKLCWCLICQTAPSRSATFSLCGFSSYTHSRQTAALVSLTFCSWFPLLLQNVSPHVGLRANMHNESDYLFVRVTVYRQSGFFQFLSLQ